uniref:Viral late gene transcription factor 3 zinc ribbon domain-containing protein n=1 Tax=viral metagenome TaxID=1070528 RepID=A0A6C0KQR5_9ZZZZ
MPSFKPKANKKIKVCKKYSTTLDGKHKEFINEFSKDELDIIPTLKHERCSLKTQLDLETDLPIEKKMEMKDRIKEINETIIELKNKKTNYFLDNSKFIFEYFENKKNINNIEENNKQITSKNQLLFNIFKIKQNPFDSDKNKDNDNDKTHDNKNIVQKYLSNIDESFIDMNSFVRETDICQFCFKGEMIPLDDEGILICNNCAVNIPYLIENEKPSYKEPPKEVCFYAYKKINHFKEILAQFQGKETTQIPDIVIEHIHLQIKKERINIDQLTHHKTKEILKKLGFNKYYEHIAFIKNKLGINPPVFSQELEDTLCNLFMEIQSPYAKTCPDYRVNFLNYYYVLFKFCELLEESQFLNDIPLLKDREKLIEQDETWKKMCVELDWEFIPTV